MKSKLKIDAATLTVIFLTASVIALTLGAALVINNDQDKPSTTTEQKEITFPDISDVPSRDNIQVTHTFSDLSETYEKSGVEYIYSSISFPNIDGGVSEATEKINGSISAFAAERVKITSFEKDAAENSYLRAENEAMEFIPYEFITRCEAVYVKDGYLSLMFRQIKSYGVTEPTEELISLCFDLLSGERVDLSGFMNVEDDVAKSFVKDIFTQHIQINPRQYYNNALEILPNVIDTSAFYLTDKGAVLYFNAGIITPEVYGIREFTVPYNKIGH